MVIEINKDIDRYQESVAMGLTAKQLVFSIASVIVGGGIVLLLYRYIGLTGSAYVAIPCVAPIALGGFYSFNGMDFYEYMGKKLHFMFGNKALTYVSIEGLGCTSKMTGGIVKSTGVFIHEDGTGGYWTEFDWGDEEDNGKGKKLLISKKPLNEFFQERSNIGYQLTENDIENIMPLMITGYYKKQE